MGIIKNFQLRKGSRSHFSLYTIHFTLSYMVRNDRGGFFSFDDNWGAS